MPVVQAQQASENGDGPRPMNKREVAHRVFAAEFNSASVEIKGTEERAPSFVLTPLGAKVNRLLFVGVLTSAEKVNDGDMWRARVSDPTGVFTMYSGQFTPEASQALASIEVPSFVAVVGKARTYEPEPGRVFVSVRPESIRVVNEEARDLWVLETAKLTTQRSEAMREARQLAAPTPEALAKLGFPAHVAEGASTAVQKYAETDLETYQEIVGEALRHLIDTSGRADAKSEAALVPKATPQPAPTAAPPVADESDPEAEAAVLAAVKELEVSDAKGAPWDEVVSRVQKSLEGSSSRPPNAGDEKAKLDAQRVEEALNALMDRGLVYEPILGRLRSA